MQLRLLFTICCLSILAGLSAQDNSSALAVDYEKFTLDNGLEVVFHLDRSDPVVAVALTAHVGSAREKEGRTGFAHLFEHLLFLESENLGKGGLDKLSARVGGSGANGSTSRDRTNYFQTVPKDALEKMLWAEADKLGWFINTVTEPVLAKEKQVVKNEKRQGVDNRPYGHTQYVIDRNLYPPDHPYHWQVIGSLEDLQNATLADVKEFFRRWYVPNNTTLVVSGDFDPAQARTWVDKYFAEIPAGAPVEPLAKRPGQLTRTVRRYHEDNFATLPELTLAWPTVPQYHPDAYALDILAEYLSEGKKAPLNQVLIDQQQLAANVRMYNYASELAGQTQLSVRAFAGKDLDEVYGAVQLAFAQFEAEGIPEKDLLRIKAGLETNFYRGLSSVLGKGFQLAQYNIFAGDPGFLNEDIQRTLAVTAADVKRVYDQYIKDRYFVATSFVPKGQTALALAGSTRAAVVEEAIVAGAEERFDPSVQATYERTPSTFDRTQEPPYGEAPKVTIPDIWEERLPNGLHIYGIENREVPLVQFELLIDGGQLLEAPARTGVANLLAELFTKGTQNRTTEELEEAIQQLGASLSVAAQKEYLRLRGNTLARNYPATIELLTEILLEPRWDEQEFALAKQRTISRIQQLRADPNAIAQNAYNRLLYGDSSLWAANILGTIESVEAIALADLQTYYEQYLDPSVARLHVVGAVTPAEVTRSLQPLAERWSARPVPTTPPATPDIPQTARVYFYDVPGAKQSVLRIGYPALPATDADYYPGVVANYILGGGGFASRLTQELREGKGYTYGIRSRFSGSEETGTFTISSGVRSNITLEAVRLIRQILSDYPATFTPQDLQTTQGFLIKSNARAFETAGAKLSLLKNISAYGWSYDYVKQREATVKRMTVERIQKLAKQYLDPDRMIWLVVGDAATQLERLKKLGYGEPVLLNPAE